MRRSRPIRWAVRAFAAVLVAGAVIHLPPVRGWLAAHGHHGGGVCPLGYGGAATAESREARRARHDRVRGDRPAMARPALGFALDVTTGADIQRWASLHGVSCATRRGGSAVECTGVPGQLLSSSAGLAAISVSFQLGSGGTLEAIRTVRRDRDVAAVAAAFTAVEDALTARAGAPARSEGSAAPAVLANGMLRQAMVDYRFADYRALVRATNMGDGFVLTEEYATMVD